MNSTGTSHRALRAAAIIIASLLSASSLTGADAPAAGVAWDPASTRAFFVGVLKWEDDTLASWPDEGRSDEKLMGVLRDRGLPEASLKYLKNERATRSATLKALDAELARSRPGETFIFYYCGHGGREAGSTVFLPYDNLSGGTISAREVGGRIAGGFKGDRVILLADCCYSGGLREAADIIEAAGKGALVLASVEASSSSTGAWTFTDSLVDIFSGKIAGDLPSGGIGYGAAREYVLECMKVADKQLGGAYRTASFPVDYALAREAPPLLPLRPAYREVFDGKAWYVARVLQVKAKKYYVTFPGFSADWDDWYPESSVRLPEFARFAEGEKVMVEWSGDWYRAKVLRADGDFHLVRYDGYGAEWDEWVATPRIKAR